MVNVAVIKKGGAFIEVSADGQNPLPRKIYAVLERPLCYTYILRKYGADAFNPDTGAHEPVETERRRLFHYDNRGLFLCQAGFYPRVRALLSDMGYAMEYIDKDPAKVADVYTADWDRVFAKFEFRPQQDACLAQIDMHNYGLVDAPPAFGKTHLMGMLGVMYPKAKIDIVTKRKDVVARHRQLLTSWIPNVGMVGGGKKDRNRRVTVYTADSLHHSDFNADFLLADEAHELMTDRYAERLGYYQYSRNFAFTATPDMRLDNAHYRMEGIFGPTIFKMTQQQAEAHKLVAHVIVQWVDVNLELNPIRGFTNQVAKKRNGVWRNEQRNQAIAAVARDYRAHDQQVLILVDTVDHALHIRKHLPEAELCYSDGALSDLDKRRFFIGHGLLQQDEVMTAQRRTEIRQSFERRDSMLVIATGVWSVGVSFDSLNVLIRADAGDSDTANVQMPGRVCRIDESTGKQCGIMVDFNDRWDRGYQARASNRRRMYHKRGWTQMLHNGTIWVPRGGRARL